MFTIKFLLPSVMLLAGFAYSTSTGAKDVYSSCIFNYKPDTSDISNTSYVDIVRSVTTPTGTTYRYAFSPPSESDKPYLLFLHGFPESAYEWRYQIEYFRQKGYGLIVPDLLGYGGTDNPSDLEAFSYKRMVLEITQLLDCEDIDKVIGIGHDFGSPLLSRVISYQQERLIAVAFLDIGYIPPGMDLDEAGVESLNKATQKGFGYPVYGYWPFQNEESAAQVLDANLDSLFTLMYTDNATYWRHNFAPYDAFRSWVTQSREAPSSRFITPDMQNQWKTIMRAQGGLGGPLKWYKSYLRGINSADEMVLQNTSGIIHKPVLLILADRDPVGMPSLQLNNTVPYAPDLWVRTVNAGHFVEVEVPHEVNKHLDCFIQQVRNVNPISFTPPICK